MDYNNYGAPQESQDAQQPQYQQPQYQTPPQYQQYQQPQYQQQPYQPQGQKQGNPMAIAGLVCGIIGLAFCWAGWFALASLVLSIIGIVCGAKGMEAAKRTNSGKGLAVAGLVCGIVGVSFALVAVTCAIACYGAANYVNSFRSYY